MTRLFDAGEALVLQRRLERRVLGILLTLDTLLIAVHIGIRATGRDTALLEITRAGSLAEFFQYLKEAAIALGVACLAWPRRDALLGCWAGLFAYLLFDDALELHEHAGAWIKDHSSALSARGDAGLLLSELGFLATVGVVGAVISLGALWRQRKALNALHRDLIALFVVLAGFGVGFDAVHSAVGLFVSPRGLGLLEDGGEMVVMSVIVARVAFELLAPRPTPATQ